MFQPPHGSALPSRTRDLDKPQKLLRNGPRNMTKSSRRRPGLDPDPWRPHLATHRNQMICCQCPSARHDGTPPELLCPCLDGSEPSLMLSGASMNQTCSGTCCGCSYSGVTLRRVCLMVSVAEEEQIQQQITLSLYKSECKMDLKKTWTYPSLWVVFPLCMAIFGLTVTDLNYFAS